MLFSQGKMDELTANYTEQDNLLFSKTIDDLVNVKRTNKSM